MRKSICLLILAIVMPAASRAQGDVEYLMEVGGGLGLVSYEGDYNSNPLKGQQPMASALLRRMLNPSWLPFQLILRQAERVVEE